MTSGRTVNQNLTAGVTESLANLDFHEFRIASDHRDGPVFQDDYRVCLSHGVISKDMDMVCPVDPSGRFTDEVTHFKGQYVKVGELNSPYVS